MSSKMKRSVDMGSGSVPRALWKLALPSIFSMLFHTLFHLVDTVFVSWLGEYPLAAMSLTFPVMFIIFALINGIAVGTTTTVSNQLGAGNDTEARDFCDASLILLLSLSLIPVPLLFPGISDGFFGFLGGEGPVLSESYRYSFWMIVGITPMAFSLLGDSLFRSQGDTVTPMKAMVLGNGINALLDPLFIFTFGWGIAGASFATFVSRFTSLAYVVYKLRADSDLRPSFRIPQKMLSRWKRIVAIGIPVFLSQGSMAIGSAAMNRILARYGAAAIGAWMLGNRVESLAFLPVFGLNGALVPFVGFNIGKGDYKRVKSALLTALVGSSIIMLSIGTLIYIWPHPILTFFKPSETVTSMATASIRASATGYLFAAVDITLWGLFQGSGYSVYGMVSQFARSLAVRIPSALLLASFFGLSGVWWCQPLSTAASGLLSLFFLSFVMRRIHEEITEKRKKTEPAATPPLTKTSEESKLESTDIG
ncbi:MAG: MATE family efflux transporter [Thermovirgaceae bacterium]